MSKRYFFGHASDVVGASDWQRRWISSLVESLRPSADCTSMLKFKVADPESRQDIALGAVVNVVK
jgi:hypothetical protein